MIKSHSIWKEMEIQFSQCKVGETVACAELKNVPESPGILVGFEAAMVGVLPNTGHL